MTPAPICLIAHRRPDHLRRCLESLAQCDGASESQLLIFIDGARNADEGIKVEEVKAVASGAKGFRQVNLIFRQTNLGMMQSIICAISETFSVYDRLIFIEDDLVFAKNFLTFLNLSLEKYQYNDEVFAISGYLFDDCRSRFGNHAFLTTRASCWGLGLWKKNWQDFSFDRALLLKQAIESGLEPFLDPPGGLSMTDKLRAGIAGTDDSWSPILYVNAALSGGLYLYPPCSLLENIGFDGSGEHALCSAAYHTSLPDDGFTIVLPQVLHEHPEADTIFLEHYSLSSKQRALGR